MNIRTKSLAIIIALLFLAGAVGGIYFGIKFLIGQFSNLDQAATITVVAVITALANAQIIASALRRAHIADLRLHKGEIYARLIEAWSAVLNPSGTGDGLTHRHFDPDLRGRETELVLWASGTLLKKYVEARILIMGQHPDAWASFKGVVQEMREDLGQSNVGLQEENLADLLHHPRTELAGERKK